MTLDVIQELTDRNFAAVVSRSEEPVVVEFYYAGWEAPWRALTAKAWAVLRWEFGERIRCAGLDTGTNREIAIRYRVETIPHVFVFWNGEVVARFMGRSRTEEVSAALESILRRDRAALEDCERRASPSGDEFTALGARQLSAFEFSS